MWSIQLKPLHCDRVLCHFDVMCGNTFHIVYMNINQMYLFGLCVFRQKIFNLINTAMENPVQPLMEEDETEKVRFLIDFLLLNVRTVTVFN